MLSGDFLPAIVFGDLFYLSGMIMRRESFLAAGPFNERFRFFNDWEFFSRLCLSGPGAYIDHDGFRRQTGRDDQISRRRPLTAMPRRQIYILRTLLRRAEAQRHVRVLRIALADACYALGRALVRCRQQRRAHPYLLFSLRERYKIFRSLLLLLRLAR